MTVSIESFARPNGGAGGEPARSGSQDASADHFATYAAAFKDRVEDALAAWLDGKLRESAGLPLAARAPVEAVSELARRGGKRLRAALAACAYEGFEGPGGADAIVLAGVSLELLQTYLLIHDDWMDKDDLRRGGPSVPAMMRTHFGDVELAAASAVLAGDYAAGLALEALLSVPCAGDRMVRAARELSRVEEEVVLGQLLDMHGPEGWDIEGTFALKTSSYTVRGPLLIGAILAGANDAACDHLSAFATPLGVAFQMRDDLLGTFGVSSSTGKARLSDLRRGKRTALIAEAARGGLGVDRLRAFGDPAAPDEALESLAADLDACGARARVEARIQVLLDQALTALANVPLSPHGRVLLTGAVSALGRRER